MKPSSKVELALSGVKRRIEILEQRNLRDSQEYRKLLAQREELFRKTQEYREIAGSRVASRLLGEREFEADIYRIGFKRHNHLFDPMFEPKIDRLPCLQLVLHRGYIFLLVLLPF